jgi:hypothetical protein
LMQNRVGFHPSEEPSTDSEMGNGPLTFLSETQAFLHLKHWV